MSGLDELLATVGIALTGGAAVGVATRGFLRRGDDLRSGLGIELREQAATKASEAKHNAEQWKLERSSVAEKQAQNRPDDVIGLPGSPSSDRVRIKTAAAQIVANAADAASRDVVRYTRYADEALARSKIAFWVSLVLGTIGFATILAGAVLCYVTGLETSIVSGVAGVLNTSIAALLYQRSDVADKRASAWFEKAGENLKESDNLQRSLGVLELIDDLETRTRLIAIAGIKQLFPGENAGSLSDAMELKR